MIDKDRRARNETMEQEERLSSEKIAALTQARDALASQLSFTAYGLLLAQIWRNMECHHNSGALVPYVASSALKNLPYHRLSDVQTISSDSNDPKDLCVKVQSFCENCSKLNNLINSETQASLDQSKMDVDSENITSKNEINLRRSLEDDDEAPAKKRLKYVATKSQSTMTHLDELLSEREKYYCEQIEALQKEKMNLRRVSILTFTISLF